MAIMRLFWDGLHTVANNSVFTTFFFVLCYCMPTVNLRSLPQIKEHIFSEIIYFPSCRNDLLTIENLDLRLY